MPITFAPPQPFAPAIAQGAGAAQVEQQNTGTLAQLYEQAGRNRQAAAQAEADRFAQNARTGAALGSSDQQHADELQFRKDQFQASLNPHARDVFAAQVGEAHLRQHAELNAWVQQQDMTFADEQRLKNQQMAVSEVQRAWSDHEITDQDRNDLLTQLRTHIDPAKQRQERALAEQETSRAAAYQKQADVVTKSEIEVAKAQRDAADRGETTRIYRDPHTGIAELHYWSQKKGEWYNPSVNHGASGKAGDAAGAAGLTAEQYLKHRAAAEKDVEALIERNENLRAKTGPDGKSLGLGDPNINWSNRTQLLAERLRGMGLAGDVHEHLGGPAPGQGGGPGSGQIPPAEAKPFGPDDAANPDQLHQVNELARQRDVVEKLPIPPGLKSQFTAATYVMDAMLRKYGTLSQSVYDRMSDDDKKNYAWARTSIDQVSRVGFQGQPQPAAPQAPAPMAGGRFPF